MESRDVFLLEILANLIEEVETIYPDRDKALAQVYNRYEHLLRKSELTQKEFRKRQLINTVLEMLRLQ